MKTIQEYLRNADRGQLLAALANDALYNTIFLLEYKEKTIDEIQNAVNHGISQARILERVVISFSRGSS